MTSLYRPVGRAAGQVASAQVQVGWYAGWAQKGRVGGGGVWWAHYVGLVRLAVVVGLRASWVARVSSRAVVVAM